MHAMWLCVVQMPRSSFLALALLIPRIIYFFARQEQSRQRSRLRWCPIPPVFPILGNYLNCFVSVLCECDILVLRLVELVTEFKLNGKSILERSGGYTVIRSVHLYVLGTESLCVIS